VRDPALDPSGGWLREARRRRSPNSDHRPPGVLVDTVVLHGISLPPGAFGTGCVADLFCNSLDWDGDPFFSKIIELRVSSHVLIERSGALVQFVPLHRRAWHAGVSRFRGRTRVNDFSVGIELEGTDERSYEDAQYEALGRVLRVLLRRFPTLTPDRVVGHCHVAPGRKTDPGPSFDWPRVARAVGLPPDWMPPEAAS
jgi:AmpD protein